MASKRSCDWCQESSNDIYGPWSGTEYCNACWQAWLGDGASKTEPIRGGSDRNTGTSCGRGGGIELGFTNKRTLSTTKAVSKPKIKRRKCSSAEPGVVTGSVLSPSSSNTATIPRALARPTLQSRKVPAHRLTVAPMVGGSELAYRLLCRRYGADLCYTPMIYSGRFVECEEYRQMEFATCAEDRPLVAHFCGNDPATLLAAARLVEESVDAIDLNLGCPQRVAHAGHFGSYLLGENDRSLILSIVRTLSEGLSVPVFCKIRLLDTLEQSIELALQLQEAGCALLAVHARHRGTPTRRRDGPADLSQVREIKRALSVPVLSNGNTTTSEDVLENLKFTGADGVMSAEGILDDPTLFRRPRAVLLARDLKKCEKKLRQAERLAERARAVDDTEDSCPLTVAEETKMASVDVLSSEISRLKRQIMAGDDQVPTPHGAESRLRLALAYLDLAVAHPVGATASTVAFHVRRICKQELTTFQLLGDLSREGSSVAGVRGLVERALEYQLRGDFAYDAEKAKKEEEAINFRRYEMECRKKFEARMAKKAKREGKDTGLYLRATQVPGGQVFGQDPSWLEEKSGDK